MIRMMQTIAKDEQLVERIQQAYYEMLERA